MLFLDLWLSVLLFFFGAPGGSVNSFQDYAKWSTCTHWEGMGLPERPAACND